MTFAVGTGVGIGTGVMPGIAVVGTVAVGSDMGSGVVVGSYVAAPAPKEGSNEAIGALRNGVGVGGNVGVAVTFGARFGVGCEEFESPTEKTSVRFA